MRSKVCLKLTNLSLRSKRLKLKILNEKSKIWCKVFRKQVQVLMIEGTFKDWRKRNQLLKKNSIRRIVKHRTKVKFNPYQVNRRNSKRLWVSSQLIFKWRLKLRIFEDKFMKRNVNCRRKSIREIWLIWESYQVIISKNRLRI